jgi:glycosyltransferase involved in cell wall biosynthesis
MSIVNKICNKFIAVSNYTKEFWIKEYRLSSEKIEVIPNGVDLSLFESTSAAKNNQILKLDSKSKVIGTVGSLTPKKGHKFLIQGAKKVLDVFPDVYFVIVGDGELKKELMKLAENLEINGRVLFLGVRDDIPKLLKEIDIFVFSSCYETGQMIGETFGIAILEAMATAKPVVATRFSGIPEVVEDGKTGILVDPANPEALAEGIIYLLKNPEKAKEMGIAGRRRVEKRFTIQTGVSKIEQSYESFNL